MKGNEAVQSEKKRASDTSDSIKYQGKNKPHICGHRTLEVYKNV